MNTPKIAALYASPIFNTLLRFPDYDRSTTLTRELQQEALLEQNPRYRNGKYHAGAPDELTTTYRVNVHDFKEEKRYDEFGARMYALIDGAYPERVHRWATQQLPAENNSVEQGQRWVASTHSYTRDASREIVASNHLDCFGSEADFATLVRGLRAYQRKTQKYAKKIAAQLRAYHQQQVAQTAADELAKLRRGVWLGAEKALTTAARVDEPGVPFLGDTDLTYEQRKQLGLREYAVYESMDGMSAAFPVGTGIALKPVKRARELEDGAVYLWQWLVNGEVCGTVLGRLDRSAKERGYLPLRSDDTGKLASYCWAAWESEDITIYRVTHYTTRSAAPVPTMQAATQPARVQPRKPQPRRELAYAA
ncbi:MAG: hypothetical protein ACRYFX_09315 [Janthinobacterium lividum]